MRSTTVICAFVLAILTHRTCSGETMVPKDVFSLGDIKIGVSTIHDVQSLLGKSSVTRSGKEDESPMQICYYNLFSGDHFYIVFESGAMGGFSRVTDFIITKQRPLGHCRSIKDKSISSSGNGVYLGQPREEFLKKFPFVFSANGNELSYQLHTTRPADSNELANLRKQWPNEKSYKFDVVISIQATFASGTLINYHVSKIESF